MRIAQLWLAAVLFPATVDVAVAECRFAWPPHESKSAKAVQAYDLQGIKLYEPLLDVLKHLDAPGSPFSQEHRIDKGSCLADWIRHDKSWREKSVGDEVEKNCVSQILYYGSDEYVRVAFAEDVPEQPGCIVVKEVDYEKNGAAENEASDRAWDEALSKKYGQHRSYTNMWGDFEGAQLEVSRYGGAIHLTLKDDAFATNKDTAITKAIRDARPTDKPRL